MADRIRLYISATRDLEIEREAVGQAVAGLPVALGWDIDVTPASGVPLDPEAIRRADLYVCLLGADVTAPVGVEWAWAAQAGVTTLAYRKRVMYSPSAQRFVREAPDVWTPFDDARELRKALRLDLARQLVERAIALGLELSEVEALQGLLDEAKEERSAEPVADDRRRGAGRGGVILGREGPTDLEG